jgi:hypothetical protein
MVNGKRKGLRERNITPGAARMWETKIEADESLKK